MEAFHFESFNELLKKPVRDETFEERQKVFLELAGDGENIDRNLLEEVPRTYEIIGGSLVPGKSLSRGAAPCIRPWIVRRDITS